MASRLDFFKVFSPADRARAIYKSWRERFIISLLRSILALGAFILLAAVTSAGAPFLKAVFVVSYVLIAAATVIPFSYAARAWIFLASVYVMSLSELLRYGILGDASIFFLGMIVFATMLLSPRAGALAAGMSVVTCVIGGFFLQNGWLPAMTPIVAEANLADWISGTLVIAALGVVVILGFQQLEKEFIDAEQRVNETLRELEEEREKLEDKVQERTLKLRRLNEIGRAIAAILDPDELLARATQLIADEFDCYFAGVFLVDVAGRQAELREGTGEIGKELRNAKFHYDVRGKSLTAAAIRMRQTRIGLDTGPDAIQFDNPALPYTRSQISVPLAVGERVIGALELHSTQEAAFQSQDVEAYQNLANQLAAAYENARLFAESQQSLAELRATQRQYLQGSWSALASERNLEYEVGEREAAKDAAELVPLALREQIIGQIELAGAENLTAEQKSLIESIANQAALALENARLVEESQSIAARERLANEIIAKVWSSTTIESILQTTVRELGRALEAAEVEIQISTEKGDE